MDVIILFHETIDDFTKFLVVESLDIFANRDVLKMQEWISSRKHRKTKWNEFKHVHVIKRFLGWNMNGLISLDRVDEGTDVLFIFWEEGHHFIIQFVDIAPEGEDTTIIKSEFGNVFCFKNSWISIKGTDVFP